jgi:hypothetical protein
LLRVSGWACAADGTAQKDHNSNTAWRDDPVYNAARCALQREFLIEFCTVSEAPK